MLRNNNDVHGNGIVTGDITDLPDEGDGRLKPGCGLTVNKGTKNGMNWNFSFYLARCVTV